MEAKKYDDVIVNKKGQIEKPVVYDPPLEEPMRDQEPEPVKPKKKKSAKKTKLPEMQDLDTKEEPVGLGPTSQWENQKEEYMPYNMRHY